MDGQTSRWSGQAVRWLVLVLAVAFALSPVFSDGFGGFRAEQFPIQHEYWPAQPAGYAFSIWLPIYLALIAAGAWGMYRHPDSPAWDRVSLPLAVSLAIGVFWVQVAHLSPLWATAMIIPMMVLALFALARCNEPWQLVPVGLYAGWLTAASAVAVSVVLTGYGWMSPVPAAVLLLVAAVALAAWMVWAVRGTWPYRAAFIWALLGVMVANVSPLNVGVLLLALIGVILMLALPNRRTGRAPWG